jgi:hypothetical protein
MRRGLFADKRSMKSVILMLAMSLALMGCQKQVQGFVDGAMSPNPRDPASIISSSNSSMGIKVSPGHVTASAAAVSMTATITPTQRTLTSGTISAQVTMSQTRVSP